MSEESQPAPEETPGTTPASGGKQGGCLRAFLLGLAIVAVVGVAAFFAMIWMGQRSIDAAKEGAVELVKAFRPVQVISTFEEFRGTTATGNDGNILEIATVTSTETFSRKTAVEMFGTVMPLGTTTSEITVPATYRYHIDLKGEWFLTSDGNRLLVIAPRIQPSLPVAFDTGKMEKKTKSGWARWDGDENLEELEESLTERLALRASDEESLEKARAAGRESVARFLQTWLLNTDAWGEDRFEEISVRFEGEAGDSLSLMPPTLTLEPKAGPEDREEVKP